MSRPIADAMSDDEFREAMRPLTSSLGAYAKAMSSMSADNGHVPAHDSRAMAELATSRQWRTDEWLEPVRNAHSYGAFISHFLAEHLAAYAANVDGATVGPSYSHMTLVRAIVDSAPVAHWLSDSTITAETRVKRSIAYRLHSANQLGRMQHLDNIVAASTETRSRCAAFATAREWTIAANAVEGEALPNSGTAFEQLISGESTGLGLTIWNLSSATIHATWYALSDGLAADMVPNGPLDPLGGTVPIMVDGGELTQWAILCWFACAQVASHRLALNGWTATPAMQSAVAQLSDVARRHRPIGR